MSCGRASVRDELEALEQVRDDATGRLERALEARFPVGSTVKCKLRHGQVVRTPGEVVRHNGRWGTVKVRLRTPTYPYYVKDIPWRDIER